MDLFHEMIIKFPSIGAYFTKAYLVLILISNIAYAVTFHFKNAKYPGLYLVRIYEKHYGYIWEQMAAAMLNSHEPPSAPKYTRNSSRHYFCA